MLLSRSVPLRPRRADRRPVCGDRPALLAALGLLAAVALTAGATLAAVEIEIETGVDVRPVAGAATPRTATAPPAPAPREGDAAAPRTAPDGRPRVDVNRAGKEELTRVPGIGPATAQRILDFREQHGPFRDVDELLKIRGIGEKTLKKLRPWVHAGEDG